MSTPSKMTRRDFIKTFGVLGAAVVGSTLASGCTPSAPATDAPKPITTPTIIQSEQLEKEINVLNWGAYIDHIIQPFQDKYGVKVNIEYYTSEDQALAKAKASPGVYDTFNVGVMWLDPAVKQGLVQPLDTGRIASYDQMYDAFHPGPYAVDGKVYGIGYGWGTNALMYNEEMAGGVVDSWAAFWDPKFKNNTALADKSRDEYLATMFYLGLDFNAPKDEDWERITQAMKDRVANMRTLWTSEDDQKRLMINNEVALADGYDYLTAVIAKENPKVHYQVPKEGTYGWFDGPELLVGAPHPNAAYKWIEFMTSAEMGKISAEQNGIHPANKQVSGMISPELNAELGLDKADETLGLLKFPISLGVDWDRKISDAWTEAKAGV